MKNYTELLSEYLKKYGSDNEMRQWLHKIFIGNGKLMATNAVTLIVTPSERSAGYADMSEKIQGLYPVESNCDHLILLGVLREVIANLPLVDCFDEVETQCSACYGDGEVTYEFYHDGETYEKESDCPICDGDGVVLTTSKEPNGKKEPTKDACIFIGNSPFTPSVVSQILFVAEWMNEDVVMYNQTEPTRASYFKIGDVKMLAMPFLNVENYPTVAKL